MFDQERSYAFVFAPEGMKNAAFPSLSFAPFWSGMSSSTISASPLAAARMSAVAPFPSVGSPWGMTILAASMCPLLRAQ